MADTIFYYSDSTTSTSSDTTIISSSRNTAKTLTSVTLGDTVTSIGANAFESCIDLKSIIIPQNVTNVYSNCFRLCTTLNQLIFLGDAPIFGSTPFSNANANLKIYRYSKRSGWSNTLDGKDVLLIDAPSQGLRTIGFGSLSSGKFSIKKQNLTNLLPYALDNFRNLYIFKGGGANTIGTVFNKDDFIKNISSSNADRLAIFTPNLATSSNYWVKSDTNLWTRTSTGTVSTDVVIPENYVIVIFAEGDPSSNLPKSINNGAIVQRYYNGKASLTSSAIPLNTLNVRLSFAIGGCGTDFQLVNNENGNYWGQGHLSCDYFIRWDNQYGALPYRWRLYYDSDGRTYYASHPTATQEALPSKGWSNGMTISII
jgi:hypothetical protein